MKAKKKRQSMARASMAQPFNKRISFSSKIVNG